MCGNCLTAWSWIENLQCGIKNISIGLVAGTKQQQDRNHLHGGGGGGGRGSLLSLVEEGPNVHKQ